MYKIVVPNMNVNIDNMKCELWKESFNVMANKYFESGNKRTLNKVFKNIISDVNACPLNEQHEFIEKIITNHKNSNKSKKI